MIPGWVLVLIAALGLGMANARDAFDLKPRPARVCAVLGTVCAGLLLLAVILYVAAL